MRTIQIGFIVNHPMTHQVMRIYRERERRKNTVLDTIQPRAFSFVGVQNDGMNYPSNTDTKNKKQHKSHVHHISSNFRPLLLLVLITPSVLVAGAARELLGGMNHMGRTSRQPSGKTFFTILDTHGGILRDWVCLKMGYP